MTQKSFTIAISTRKLERFCLAAIDSILKSKNIPSHEFLVVADFCDDKNLMNEIIKRNIKVVVNQKPLSLSVKFKQLTKMCQTDVFIITQDDLVFDPYAICEVLKAFQTNKPPTMVVSQVLPKRPLNFFQSILAVGVKLVYEIGKRWKNEDNYLLANGMLMAFEMKHLKKLTIPDNVINFDTFLYLENKRKKGKFFLCDNSIVYKKLPSVFLEHLGQSSRFLFSRRELQQYFNHSIAEEYVAPRWVTIRVLIKLLIEIPLMTVLYLCVLVLTRIFRKKDSRVINSLWKPDMSTK